MDSFDHEMAGVSDEQILSYQATFPLDLSPVKDGMIRVEQASNQPVDLVLTRSSYSPSLKNVLATNETEFGQTIDFGFDYVQWNHTHLSGLDGSSLTITMEETTLSQQSTQESGELYSGGQGRLGMSMDEGWDVEDVWEFNNTEFATYYSVLLIEEEGTLDASLSSGSTKQVSQLRSNTSPIYPSQVPDILHQFRFHIGKAAANTRLKSNVCRNLSIRRHHHGAEHHFRGF